MGDLMAAAAGSPARVIIVSSRADIGIAQVVYADVAGSIGVETPRLGIVIDAGHRQKIVNGVIYTVGTAYAYANTEVPILQVGQRDTGLLKVGTLVQILEDDIDGIRRIGPADTGGEYIQTNLMTDYNIANVEEGIMLAMGNQVEAGRLPNPNAVPGTKTVAGPVVDYYPGANGMVIIGGADPAHRRIELSRDTYNFMFVDANPDEPVATRMEVRHQRRTMTRLAFEAIQKNHANSMFVIATTDMANNAIAVTFVIYNLGNELDGIPGVGGFRSPDVDAFKKYPAGDSVWTASAGLPADPGDDDVDYELYLSAVGPWTKVASGSTLDPFQFSVTGNTLFFRDSAGPAKSVVMENTTIRAILQDLEDNEEIEIIDDDGVMKIEEIGDITLTGNRTWTIGAEFADTVTIGAISGDTNRLTIEGTGESELDFGIVTARFTLNAPDVTVTTSGNIVASGAGAIALTSGTFVVAGTGYGSTPADFVVNGDVIIDISGLGDTNAFAFTTAGGARIITFIHPTAPYAVTGTTAPATPVFTGGGLIFTYTAATTEITDVDAVNLSIVNTNVIGIITTNATAGTISLAVTS
jgi:hypothetical protein